MKIVLHTDAADQIRDFKSAELSKGSLKWIIVENISIFHYDCVFFMNIPEIKRAN